MQDLLPTAGQGLPGGALVAGDGRMVCRQTGLDGEPGRGLLMLRGSSECVVDEMESLRVGRSS